MISLTEFLQQLRQAGFAISPATSVEIYRVLPSLHSVEQLHLALRMLICTNRQQQDLFDFIWEITYRDLHPEVADDESSYGEPETASDEISASSEIATDLPIQMLGTTDAPYCPNPGQIASGTIGSNDPSVALIRFASDLKGVAQQMIQGNRENAVAMLLRYLLTANQQIAAFGLQRQQALAEIESMLDYAVPDHSQDLLAILNQHLDQLLRERMTEQVQYGRQLRVQQLEQLPLLLLQSSAELYQVLRQLGRKLASKHIRQQKKGRHKINLRQTIRANIQHGGTLLELRQQTPRLDRPKLVILTDVSSSTMRATRLFLTILWHAKHVFSDIRFFEFIASVIDVTTEWKRAESVDQAVDQALQRWEEQSFGKQNSDYHQAMSMFERLYGRTLSSRDTIILLGDLRDWLGPWKDDAPVSATVLHTLQHQVKQLLVLNPEAKNAWNTGDSIVGYVQAKGIAVYEVDTLEKLVDVMLDL